MSLRNHAQPEPVRPSALVKEIDAIEGALDSLCELLFFSSPNKVDPGGLYELLRPLHKRLVTAAEGLNALKL